MIAEPDDDRDKVAVEARTSQTLARELEVVNEQNRNNTWRAHRTRLLNLFKAFQERRSKFPGEVYNVMVPIEGVGNNNNNFITTDVPAVGNSYGNGGEVDYDLIMRMLSPPSDIIEAPQPDNVPSGILDDDSFFN